MIYPVGMVDVQRVRIQWSGTTVVGSGVTTLHTTEDAASLISEFRLVLASMSSAIPNGTTITFPTSGETIDSASGDATGAWTAPAVGAVGGADAGKWSSGVGLRIAWGTNVYASGRRVKGSTFVVPMAAAAFSSSGTPDATMLSAWNGLISTFVGNVSPGFCIYSRPSAAHPTGGVAAVTTGVIPPKVSWLYSRRT